MHPDIENLIEMALADGVMTDKKREIILRKAETLGEDIDEVEMIIDGRIALMIKERGVQMTDSSSSPNNELISCPSCGASIESFSTNCGYCSFEIKNVEVSGSVKKLIIQLEQAELTAKNSKSSGGLIGGLMSMIDPSIANEKKIFESKASVISTFPIPTTKSEILEFLSLSVSQVNNIKIDFATKMAGAKGTYGYRILYRDSWMAMATQVIMKARFSMKDDQKTLNEIEGYARQLGIK